MGFLVPAGVYRVDRTGVILPPIWAPFTEICFLFFSPELRYIHSVMTHAVSSVYVVSDLFVTATPVRILHVVYSMIYGLIYFIFTVVYHVLGGTWTYHFISFFVFVFVKCK